MLVRLLDNLWVNRMNIPLRRFAFATRRGPPSKGELLAHEEWGVLVRLLDNRWVNRMNIPLRRFAYATHRCPPSKGELLAPGLSPAYVKLHRLALSRGGAMK